MRVVIYDDEDMEPITVINLKGLTRRDLEQRGMRWCVCVLLRPGIKMRSVQNSALQRHIVPA
jgi:hypothetical protein